MHAAYDNRGPLEATSCQPARPAASRNLLRAPLHGAACPAHLHRDWSCRRAYLHLMGVRRNTNLNMERVSADLKAIRAENSQLTKQLG